MVLGVAALAVLILTFAGPRMAQQPPSPAQRSFTTRNTYQVSQAHSISLNLGYAMSSSRNQGVGQFALPERAWTSKDSNWNVEVVQFSNDECIQPDKLRHAVGCDDVTEFR